MQQFLFFFKENGTLIQLALFWISLVSQIKATDHGDPAKTSTSRLHVEWLPQPEPSSEYPAFDEAHFTFAVMESDPVTQMVGIISTEITMSLLWFDIVGKYTDIILCPIPAWLRNHKKTPQKTWQEHSALFVST